MHVDNARNGFIKHVNFVLSGWFEWMDVKGTGLSSVCHTFATTGKLQRTHYNLLPSYQHNFLFLVIGVLFLIFLYTGNVHSKNVETIFDEQIIITSFGLSDIVTYICQSTAYVLYYEGTTIVEADNYSR